MRLTSKQKRVTTDQMSLTIDQMRGLTDQMRFTADQRRVTTDQMRVTVDRMKDLPPCQLLSRFPKLPMTSQNTKPKPPCLKSRLSHLVTMVFHRAMFYRSLIQTLTILPSTKVTQTPLLMTETILRC